MPVYWGEQQQQQQKRLKGYSKNCCSGSFMSAAEATCESKFADSGSAGTSASPGMFWHPYCYTSSTAGRWAFWFLFCKSHQLLCRFSSTAATICLCSINDNSGLNNVCMSDPNTQSVCSSSLFSPSLSLSEDIAQEDHFRCTDNPPVMWCTRRCFLAVARDHRCTCRHFHGTKILIKIPQKQFDAEDSRSTRPLLRHWWMQQCFLMCLNSVVNKNFA